MNRWARLRQSFWFVPSLLCLAAVILAEGLILIDRQLGDSALGTISALITTVGESGSRDLLGAIAGSMLTVASTTFSITIAVLALSSSTYGPRLVRNFMADRGNQFVLGIFVATFLYSLMVLRSIREINNGAEGYFVPHLAVNVAVLLAVVSIGVLVYFIHHISDSVQVWTLAEQVHHDLVRTVNRLYPEVSDHGVRESAGAPSGRGLPTDLAEGATLTSPKTGYVQGVDLDRLGSLAEKRSLVVAVKVRPGQHIIEGGVLAVLWPPSELDDEGCREARRAVRIGRARTPEQDVEFPVLLLEEMAVRALSPSTNDPYTAINALDKLASGLVVLAGRPTPSRCRYDPQGRLRVIAPGVSLTQLVEHLVNAMRVYALPHPTVLHRTLELLEQVGGASDDPTVRRRLAGHTWDLVEAFSQAYDHSADREALNRRASHVRERLLGSR